jgi:hypothetical protein
MNFTDRLYVEIVPLESPHPPTPHPIRHGRFDPAYVYKVLGIYNPSETSECYLMLANPQREIWFIPQRHARAFKLIDSGEFFLAKSEGNTVRACTCSREVQPTAAVAR